MSVSQSQIAREVAANPGLGELQAYYRLKAINDLHRSGELAKAGYRHLLK